MFWIRVNQYCQYFILIRHLVHKDCWVSNLIWFCGAVILIKTWELSMYVMMHGFTYSALPDEISTRLSRQTRNIQRKLERYFPREFYINRLPAQFRNVVPVVPLRFTKRIPTLTPGIHGYNLVPRVFASHVIC